MKAGVGWTRRRAGGCLSACLFLGSGIALAADPVRPLDLSIDYDKYQIEEVIVEAEPWRAPAADDDRWRDTRTLQTGRITWGYDSAQDELERRLETDLYRTSFDLRDPMPTSTLFRVKF